MSQHTALIVDDEADIRELLSITLEHMDIKTCAAADLAEAQQQLADNSVDLCITDMRLPDGNGIELIEHIQAQYPHIPVAMITAHGNMESAIAALKAGAFDFVSKPVDLAMLRKLVNTALKLADKNRSTDAVEDDSSVKLLGTSTPMQEVRDTIEKLARSQAPVYISGESGSGKELAARLIHEKGPRADKPFIPVNCGAIPEELMESELFGHKKGSFTGAVSDKAGLFQAADGGTLFLDEVADLPLHMQVKLLRAIQEKSVRPVGSQEEVPVDVRILSATHEDLDNLVKQGRFRQDLYYRINVIRLPMPSLRQRKEDIPLLAQHVLNRMAEQQRITPPKLDDSAMTALQHHPFPGNVRELENTLERAMTLCEHNTIKKEDLGLPEPASETVTPDDNSEALDDQLENVEKQAIQQALEQTRYNKTAAAKLLGISFRALRYRMKKLGME